MKLIIWRVRQDGAVFSQIQPDGTDKSICFASKSFNNAERNKPIIELELLAIFYGITYFEPYLYGRYFLVRTDHKPLVYLFNLKNPSQRLLRIRLELEEYKFTIEYIKGTQNVVADALSRMELEEIKECTQNKAEVKLLTRSMTRKMQRQTQKVGESKEEDTIELIVYEDHNAKFNRKIPKLVVKDNILEARMNKKTNIQNKYDRYDSRRKTLTSEVIYVFATESKRIQYQYIPLVN